VDRADDRAVDLGAAGLGGDVHCGRQACPPQSAAAGLQRRLRRGDGLPGVPFIVRRRNPDDLSKERQRISADQSELQAKLNSFRAILRVEDPYVGERYAQLVAATRGVAGAFIKEAWNTDPAGQDVQVHNPSWDFSELDQYDEAYLRAVADHLGWMYAPLRRKVREGPVPVEARQPRRRRQVIPRVAASDFMPVGSLCLNYPRGAYGGNDGSPASDTLPC
jgi:hypothetical protein